uniref:Uncharacterized protein n=1 Tax=Arundo donax TaxID=35708 RepID=A0A0A9B367_ARUDO
MGVRLQGFLILNANEVDYYVNCPAMISSKLLFKNDWFKTTIIWCLGCELKRGVFRS